MRNAHWAHRWRDIVRAASLVVCAGAQAAAPPARDQGLAGIWELSLDGTNRKCRILLRAEFSAAGRQQITIPMVCLRAFRVLAPVDAWSQTGDRLEFSGRAGEIVLDFGAKAGTFVASGPQGQSYRLAAIQAAAQKNEAFALQVKGSASPAPAPLATKQDSPAAGRYSILREGGKDTGCMLTMDKHAKAAGREKASLAPGCRDQGIVIFDPAGWQIVDGRLVLTARKGHKTHLDAQPDGTWKKDPKEGKSLSLKKL